MRNKLNIFYDKNRFECQTIFKKLSISHKCNVVISELILTNSHNMFFYIRTNYFSTLYDYVTNN
jgi:hypothetical protein